jgi:hypothetical protein
MLTLIVYLFLDFIYIQYKKKQKKIYCYFYIVLIYWYQKKKFKNYLKIFKKQLLSRTKYPERQSQYTWLQNTRGYRGSLTHHHWLINEISIYKSWVTKSNVY